MHRFGASGYTYTYRQAASAADWRRPRIYLATCLRKPVGAPGQTVSNIRLLIAAIFGVPIEIFRTKSMSKIIVTSRAGDQITLDVQAGFNVMEVIRDASVDEPFALCGGHCSCATCHIYVEPSFMDRMPAISADESDLLDSSDHRRPNSRLSCQIPFDPTLDGLAVEVAPEG